MLSSLWHATGTASEDINARRWRRRLQLAGRVRPVLGVHRFVAKSPKGLAAGGGETRTLARLLKRRLVVAAMVG
jgi:hypothetical protein